MARTTQLGLLAAVLVLLAVALLRPGSPPQPRADSLPAEARATLRLIAAGGPFSYDRDGTVFQNREGRLPSRPRGYYREYTVETPGSPDRGPRRIVTGGRPPTEFYYTPDHYRSFQAIEDVMHGSSADTR